MLDQWKQAALRVPALPAGRRLRSRAAPLLLLLSLLAVPAGPALANPLETFGFGSRWVAMGGAVTALVDDVASIYYNPAGLIHATSVQLMAGYFYADQHLVVNGYDIQEDSVSGLVAGFALPPFQLGPIKMGGGAAIHVPDKRVARTLAIPYDQPTWVRYGARNQRMVVMTPFSFEIFPWLSVGATVSMFMRTSGGPDFVLREDRPENRGLWSEGSISTSQRPSFFPTAGVQVRPLDWLSFGFCYRGKNEVLYKVPMKVHIEPLYIFPGNTLFPLLGESLIDMNQHVYSFFAPEEFSLGFGFDVGEVLKVGLDLTLSRWGALKQPAPEGATYYSGGIAQLVPPNPNYPLPPPGYSDILTPAIGAELKALSFAFWELFVRAGYRYRPNPAPTPSGWNNFLDNETHIFSGGIGVQFLHLKEKLKVLNGPVRIDLHGQYTWLVEETSLEVNPVGDAFGDLAYRGSVFNGGVTLLVSF